VEGLPLRGEMLRAKARLTC